MVDTVRTLAALQALLADNTAGDISPQDARDVLVTSDYWARKAMWRSPIAVPSDDDILWTGSDVAGMTLVSITGTQTITEGDGMLSVAFQDQSPNDVNSLLAARTISTGDIWSMPMRLWETVAENFCMGGLILTDGTAATSNAITCFVYRDGAGVYNLEERHGTLTNMATAGTGSALVVGQLAPNPIWVRIHYAAANSFNVSWGPDGLSYIGTANVTPTITPTHVGVMWSSWNASATDGRRVNTYGMLQKTA